MCYSLEVSLELIDVQWPRPLSSRRGRSRSRARGRDRSRNCDIGLSLKTWLTENGCKGLGKTITSETAKFRRLTYPGIR